jgi:GTPase SAR1 family protein
MNKPIQFISIDSNGKCLLTPEAVHMITKIEDNIAVICVAGLYRTGKSYLLNRLLGRQEAFEIGPTINSCTKGIWIWSEPIYLKERNIKVLLIDTEGLGSAFEDRNETIDMEIFCLGVLLSSLFIYNSMKNIDESAIESLALVINFAKKIQSSFKELDNYSNNFPSFLWVLRDFALELIDSNGRVMSPVQYLENSLKNIDRDDPETIKKNDIRNILKIFFKERDCFTLIRPINDEKKLRNIDKLPTNELRKEFMTQMESLVSRIYNNVRPKVVQGSYLNGKMYINLVKMYINSLNNDTLPDVKTSWKIVVETQMDQIYEKCFNYYIEEMLAIDYTKIKGLEELIKHHNKFKLVAFDYLSELSNINVPVGVYLDFMRRLEEKLNDQFEQFVSKWNEMTVKTCQNIAEQIINEYKESNDTGDVFVALDLIEDVFKLIDESVSNVKKYELIYPVLLNFFIDLFKKGFKNIKSKHENDINKLTQERNIMQGLLDQAKETLKQTREEYECQVSELKEQQHGLRSEV